MRLPFVSRHAFDLLSNELERAHLLAEKAQLDCQRQVNQAHQETREALSEARAAMREAVDMTRVASKALFGSNTEEQAGVRSSVGGNDREIARKRRIEAGQA